MVFRGTNLRIFCDWIFWGTMRGIISLIGAMFRSLSNCISYRFNRTDCEEQEDDSDDDTSASAVELETINQKTQVEKKQAYVSTYEAVGHFLQYFELDRTNDVVCGIEYFARCPDETVFIRIVTGEQVGEVYKRRVRKDKRGQRFFTLSGERLYLDESVKEMR